MLQKPLRQNYVCLYVKTNKQQCSAMLFAVKNSKTVLYLI